MSASRAWPSSGKGLPIDALGALEQRFERLRAERAKDEHAGARQQRRVELERRILGRRADQRDRAVLHHRQEGILLRAVEAMDLVDEQERALPLRAARARGVEDLLQFRDARMDRRDLHECVAARRADEPRDRRLAAARRPPEDHRAERRRREQARQRAVRPGQMLLARDLGERHRPQPLGERRRRRLRLGARGRREGSWRALSRADDPLSSGGDDGPCRRERRRLAGRLPAPHCPPFLRNRRAGS